MTEEDTVGLRILRIAAAHPILSTLSRKDLAATLKVSYETLRKWITGEAAPSRKRAESIAARMGVRPETFMHGVVYEVPSMRRPGEAGAENQAAHPVGHESVISAPRPRLTTVDWRDREMIHEHPQFSVSVPDDSMAPILWRGMTADFDTEPVKRGELRNQEVVLVEDAAGDWHIRTYVRATSARWQAVPQRGVALESDRDGLVLLAVLIGHYGRGGTQS